ncbi:MAG: hypothetical protein HYT07_03565 [Candidatus Levybacteria bacterium]|nr:hypothetical protein [Candidatus Levybacteria bacterium]
MKIKVLFGLFLFLLLFLVPVNSAQASHCNGNCGADTCSPNDQCLRDDFGQYCDDPNNSCPHQFGTPTPTRTPTPTLTPTPTGKPTPTPTPFCQSNGKGCIQNNQCCSNFCNALQCADAPTPTPTPTPIPIQQLCSVPNYCTSSDECKTNNGSPLVDKKCESPEICCQPAPPDPGTACLSPNYCASEGECRNDGGNSLGPRENYCGKSEICCQKTLVTCSSPDICVNKASECPIFAGALLLGKSDDCNGQFCCRPAPPGTSECDPGKNNCPEGKVCRFAVEDNVTRYKCVNFDIYIAPTNAAVCTEWVDENGNPTDENDDNKICRTINTAIGGISTQPKDFVTRIYSIVLGLAGGIALILIILSGYRFIASQGNPEALQAARGQLLSAIIGLLFIIFSFVILQVIGVDILHIPGFNP